MAFSDSLSVDYLVVNILLQRVLQGFFRVVVTFIRAYVPLLESSTFIVMEVLVEHLILALFQLYVLELGVNVRPHILVFDFLLLLLGLLLIDVGVLVHRILPSLLLALFDQLVHVLYLVCVALNRRFN